MTKEEIIKKARDLKDLKIMLEELTAEIGTIEDELKAEMTATGKEEMTVDVFKIRYTTVTSSRLDTTAIKKELPDVAARYTKTNTYKRFSIA
jgi:predicted phage-related endonuclease